MPPRRRPADVGLRKISAHRLGRLYGTSEAWPQEEVAEVLEILHLAGPRNLYPLPPQYRCVETLPDALRHPAQATGTAGRLRGGNTVPILSYLRRHEPRRGGTQRSAFSELPTAVRSLLNPARPAAYYRTGEACSQGGSPL
jgi:hypothetical protein